jgi:hypothetical protein
MGTKISMKKYYAIQSTKKIGVQGEKGAGNSGAG